MANKHLATYLNDHMAGSIAGLELLEYIASAGKGTEKVARELHAEVAEDRRALEDLMSRLGIGQSTPRKVSAWVAEKLTQVKLRMDDPTGGAFRLFEAFEAVSLGVEGKRLLWRALAAASEAEPALAGHDYDHLIRRAESQRLQLENLRIGAVGEALAQ